MSETANIIYEGHAVFACSAWLYDVLRSPDSLQKVVSRTEEKIHSVPNLEFQAIAVSGISGLILGTALAIRLHKRLIIVRKEKESRHSSFITEGVLSIDGVDRINYVIVDDFIFTGQTIRRIQAEVCIHTNNRSKCLGAFLYNESVFLTGTDLPEFTPEQFTYYLESRIPR